jgi:predicted transcriptional regulator
MNWQNRRMKPAEYREIIEDLGMNTAQAGRFLGVSRKTAYRYHDGDSLIPAPISLLLRLMLVRGEVPEVPPFQGVRARRAAEKQALAP